MFRQAGDTQSLLQLLILLGKKNGGSRTIAILHITYRLTMRLVSAHLSQWDVNFAGKWDSALKGNSALRAHVARAMGTSSAYAKQPEGHCIARPCEVSSLPARPQTAQDFVSHHHAHHRTLRRSLRHPPVHRDTTIGGHVSQADFQRTATPPAAEYSHQLRTMDFAT